MRGAMNNEICTGKMPTDSIHFIFLHFYYVLIDCMAGCFCVWMCQPCIDGSCFICSRAARARFSLIPQFFFFFAIHVFTIGFDKIRSIYSFFSLHHCAWLYDFCSFPIVFLHFFGLIVSIVLQNAFFLHIYLSGMTKRCDSNWKIFYINWWQWSIAEYGQQLHYWAQNAHTVLQIHIPKWMRETPDCEETNTPYHHYFNTITFFIKILLQSENYIQVSSFQLIIFTKINCEYFILPENFW